MKVAIYSSRDYEKEYLLDANENRHDLQFISQRLTLETLELAKGSEAISIFVNDDASEPILKRMSEIGIKYLTLRSAGFNHVNLKAAAEQGLLVARVPAYSPNAVAEHTIALILALNRKLIKADSRIHQHNFLLDGLVGFDLIGKTVGVIGTGKIGSIVARILHGFGCKVLAFDKFENYDLVKHYNVEYPGLKNLYRRSDIVTLHIPLNPETKYGINQDSIEHMKKGVMLINTSRGGLVNTIDVIKALETKHIAYFGLDVYEKEEYLFFEDHSKKSIQDDTFAKLLTFDNVLITGHQAFLTKEALKNISATTIYNIDCFEKRILCENLIST